MPSPLDTAAQAAAIAADAAHQALVAAGIADPQVVVTFAWADGGMEFVAASRVPAKRRDLLAQSLEASAEEALEP
jgi:hypothetical protein